MFSKFYEKEVGGKRSLERNPDLIFEELGNQTDFLKKNQGDLHIQLGRLVKAHEIDKTKKMMENRNLISEIDQLRADLDIQRKRKSNARNRSNLNKTYDSGMPDEKQDLAVTYNARLQELNYINSVCSELLNKNQSLETKLRSRMEANDIQDEVNIGDN